jgi:hypothetical protein
VKRTLVGVAVGAAFLAALVLATLDQMRVHCEVCMVYRGHQACQEARATDRSQALQQATSSACARISSGVTDGIQCNNTPPASVRCSE